MRVLFRVDATSEIGTGHFMRCLNLAEALKPVSKKICFISRNLPNHLQILLVKKNYDFLPLYCLDNSSFPDDLAHSHWLGTSQEIDVLDTIQLAVGIWDWLVVDHYGLDERWEKRFRLSAKKILVIDDLADRKHDCDFLLDQNLFIDLDTRYNNKVPLYCVLLLGPRFALLRNEFIQLRKKAKMRTGYIKRVLIFFGSVDADNHTLAAIQALANIHKPDLQVDVVIGIQNPNLQQIQSLCADNNFICHIQTEQMAELILAADLAIGAGGISTYERLFLRLPAILKPVSFNQIEALKYMSNMGLFDLFSTQQDLEVKLQYILNKENSSPLDCVEDGSRKLAKLMAAEFMYLENTKPLDIRRTFNWLRNKELRANFVIARAPLRSEHFMYWRKLLHDSEQRVFSIFYFSKHVGNCGLKNINIENRDCEIWIYVADLSARGRGLADCAIEALLAKARHDLLCTKVYLHVAKNNLAAIRLYKNHNFYTNEKFLEGRWAGRDADILYMEKEL